jgi:predicted RNA-binding protein with PIN domain
VRWLVDGMNVIGSRPTGWWRDRPGAMRGLVERLDELAAESGDELTVVFDGSPFEIRPRRVEVEFAPGGPNAADDAIARLVAADPEPSAMRVVTSDADLARRAREAGAEVVTAGSFLRRLDG